MTSEFDEVQEKVELEVKAAKFKLGASVLLLIFVVSIIYFMLK